jgi:hypothetical protein
MSLGIRSRKDRREELLDHFVLPNDHLLQLLLHELPVLGKLQQDVAKRFGFGRRSGGHGRRGGGSGQVARD